MRIQRSIFLLTLTLENSESVPMQAYDSNFDPLPIEHTGNTVNIQTYMPNQVMLVLLAESQIELVGVSLAGLQFADDILLNLIQYKPGLPTNNIAEYFNRPSIRLKTWNQPGCVVFDFFHPNPFAYHMYVGNQIRI